jgi:hypothetical protein
MNFKPKKVTHLLGFGILIILILVAIATIPKFSANAKTKAISDIKKCQSEKSIESCSKRVFLKYEESSGPALTTDLLEEMMESGLVEYNCHTLSHALGYYAEENTPSESSKGNSVICGGGYLHGVFESAANGGSLERVTQLGLELCSLPNTDLQSCIHGVGHALSLDNIEIKKSNEVCDSISLELKVDNLDHRRAQDAHFQCISGWVMQSKLTIIQKANHSTEQLKLPSTEQICLTLEEDSTPYNYCVISWAKERFNNLPPYADSEITSELNLLGNYCKSLTVQNSTIKQPLHHGSSTGSDIRDLCWNEIGSMIATTQLPALAIENIEYTAKLMQAVCGPEATEIYLCMRNFVASRKMIVHNQPNYHNEFCSKIVKELYSICQDEFRITQKESS